MDLRHTAIALAFRGLALTGADRWAGPIAQGRGVILTLHRVCTPSQDPFAPNGILEITPEFLDAALGHLREAGIDLVSMDEAARRISAPERHPFFVALTFDDGFRDTLDVALPILQKHLAPACVFVVPGFAERRAPLWWVDLENAIRALPEIGIVLNGKRHQWPAGNSSEKRRAFAGVYWLLRSHPESALRDNVAALSMQARQDSQETAGQLCLDWNGIKALSRDPLITIGAHTLTHPRLAMVGPELALDEMAGSRVRLEEEIGQPVRHFAYPVGDRTSAAAHEFGLAARSGFTTAVTTRPGHVFAEHAEHLHALPRVSLNGLHQNNAALRAILSGLPFMALNRGRKLDCR